MSISKSIKQSSEKYNLELNNGLYFFDDATLGMIINSCGSKGIGDKIVPDSILGVCITPACQIHDFDYFVGQTFEDKKNADRRFLENMRKIIEYDSKFLNMPDTRHFKTSHFDLLGSSSRSRLSINSLNLSSFSYPSQ